MIPRKITLWQVKLGDEYGAKRYDVAAYSIDRAIQTAMAQHGYTHQVQHGYTHQVLLVEQLGDVYICQDDY